ncbi:transcription termination factor, mitochondrial [Sitophilus oryzae]|uniref:Transcription termination factor, mitochondrial n=1 Tax=Sitophilus oryzae TaxID=7048 RepID=A0A6J2XPZ4_SITOR|nr:transcription termination factor, mitochondrial [Sitophilus oryzae]
MSHYTYSILLKLFQDFGFANEELLKDLWIFRYSADFILARCEMIRKYKIVNIRTWMIRCPEETLLKHIRREMENKDILGEYSVTEYLSNKLECSENVAKYLIRKHPQLQTRSILKLRETIDFLYKHGFTSTHICRVSKILLHSKKTTEKRIKSLATLGVKSVSLYILTKSQKQYEEHIDNLLKSK